MFKIPGNSRQEFFCSGLFTGLTDGLARPDRTHNSSSYAGSPAAESPRE